METLRQDLRFALRTMRKHPGFTLIIILTLTLGIGANTAIFSVVNAVILRPLPFKAPDRLVYLWEDTRGTRYQAGTLSNFITVRPGSYHDWKSQSRSFEAMSACRWKQVMLTGTDRTEMAWANQVTEGFFEMLGVPALLGRTFAPEEYGPNSQSVVILSHALWSARFGADPDIIGRAVSLDNASVTVIGVMPACFYPDRFNSPQLWLPLWFNAEQQNDRVTWGLTTIARLKPGVTSEQAASEMDVIGDRIEQAHPEHYKNMGAALVPAQSELTGGYERLFSLLLGAVMLVLLIACVNVANLLLVRTTERWKEFAVRAALGATRGRLMRQLLCESLLLAVTAGTLGLLLAYTSLRSIIALLPAQANVPRLDEIKLGWSVMLFTLGVSLLVGLFFGLAPALKAGQADLSEALKEGGRSGGQGAGSRHLGNALVVGEVALSLILLVGAGLLMGSFLRVARIDPGFRPANLLILHLRVPEFRYGNYEVGGKNPARVRLFEQVEQHLSTLPGVESVAVTSKLPMKQGVDPWAFHIEGREPLPDAQRSGNAAAVSGQAGLSDHGNTSIQRISPAYFRTLGVPLVKGRYLDERDTADQPGVTLINETFARKYFPDEDPVGKKVTAIMTSYFPKLTVVGVVADFKMNALDRPVFPEMFWPVAQWPGRDCWLILRTNADLLALSAAAREEIASFDRDLPVEEVQAMTAVIAASMWRYRFSAWLLGLFSALAITLAAAGIYGVMSYAVTQRTREIGIRLALGAQPRNVLSQVVKEGMRLAVSGLVLGVATSLILGRVVASLLFGVTATDPLIIAVVSLLLAAVALLACLLPARRAARVDPMTALRHE